MGIYLNPGNANYQMAINSQIFIDKTQMISYLNTLINTDSRYLSVSRPRRFGKTIAADMICAYYDREADSRKMFSALKISTCETAKLPSWDKYLGKFDVIRLVMTDFFKTGNDIDSGVNKICSRVLTELSDAYPDVEYDKDDFFYSLGRFYKSSGYQFVIIIDEWDSVFRRNDRGLEDQTKYLDFLRDWMKDKPYIALAYMTGILPIKKYGQHSALNMFTEYSMISPKRLARYTGFTTEEVEGICRESGLNYNDMCDWYDGYHISNNPIGEPIRKNTPSAELGMFEIYCPLSVVSAAMFGKLENYWNKTETYEALAEYIRKDFDGLKDAVALLMDGGSISVDISTYQNDMTTFTCRDDVLSLLIHLGYLGYDDETKEVFIPNREILDEFKTSTKSAEWSTTFKSFEISQKLLEATWKMDSDKVAELVERAHDLAGNKTYNDEAALSYGIQLAYYAAQKYYTTVLELDSGKGYADIVYLPSPNYPDKPVLLVELKYNKDADTAIRQIKKQRYPDRLEHYKGNILLVGIDYDKDTRNDDPDFKHHHCLIEKA